MRKQSWSLVVFVVAWMLNPALLSGCGRLGLGFQFGEAEVVAVVNDANRAGPLRHEHEGHTYEVSFEVAQAQGEDKVSALVPGAARGAVRQAHACGNRTFLRSAAACLDVTEVPVEGKLLVKRVGPGGGVVVADAPAKGKLRVIGTRLERAHLELSAGKTSVDVLFEGKSRSFRVERVFSRGSLARTPRHRASHSALLSGAGGALVWRLSCCRRGAGPCERLPTTPPASLPGAAPPRRRAGPRRPSPRCLG